MDLRPNDLHSIFGTLSETSVLLCEPETFWLFKLQDRDIKVRHSDSIQRDAQRLVIKQTNESRLWDFQIISLSENWDSDTALWKKGDCEMHIKAKKWDCETCEIRWEFYETHGFWTTIHHPL